MSFTSTPLGQGKLLDRNPLLYKQRPSTRSLSSNGAPLGRSATFSRDAPSDESIARPARSKEREQAAASHGPKIITSPPNPTKWSVKDTSVNIASAFLQAANDMQSDNPNAAWASGRTINPIPRSTSVDYESSKVTIPARRPSRNPFSKQSTSLLSIPDSDRDIEGNSLEHSRVTRRGPVPATYYLRQPSPEPGHPTANGTNGSYDYSAEEREFQAEKNLENGALRRTNAAYKRNRIPQDNMAYQPSQSDLESSDGVDDLIKGHRRRRKKEPAGGPLTSLPVAGYDKRRKRRTRNANDVGIEDEDSGSDDPMSDQNSVDHANPPRQRSAPPSRVGPIPEPYPLLEQLDTTNPDVSMDVEQGLGPVLEVKENPAPRRRSKSLERQQKRPFSLGGLLGKLVHTSYVCVSAVITFFWRVISTLLFILGRTLGFLLHVLFVVPVQWLSGPNSGPIYNLGKYLALACILYGTYYLLRNGRVAWLPGMQIPSRPFSASDLPAGDIAELSTRLQQLEAALSSLSRDSKRYNTRYETTAETHRELVLKLGLLEARLLQESLRAAEAEKEARLASSKELENVKHEVESLHAQLQPNPAFTSIEEHLDEESKERLKALEARVGTVEGSVKEALETRKSVGASVPWWTMFGSSDSNSELMIKSTDGQDVTLLLKHMIEMEASRYSKDTIARPDFALHSGGSTVIPSLTSPTFEVKPQTLRGQLVGMLTGNGHAIGRPPVTALHHELHNGHCWPFAGSRGQLGVALAAPTYITDVTIDHVAREVSFDMRSAPREMELWGMVDGRDNVRRVEAWKTERAMARDEAESRGEDLGEDLLGEDSYPRTLPRKPQYIRIAKFAYDVHSSNNVQTFPVSQEIQDLGIDFGIVVLLVKNNWGRDDFTCLYRLRVHGHRLGGTPSPDSEEGISS